MGKTEVLKDSPINLPADVSELLVGIGRLQMSELFRRLGKAVQINLVYKIKEQKAYKKLTRSDGQSYTWDEFCKEKLLMSSRHVNDLLTARDKMLDESLSEVAMIGFTLRDNSDEDLPKGLPAYVEGETVTLEVKGQKREIPVSKARRGEIQAAIDLLQDERDRTLSSALTEVNSLNTAKEGLEVQIRKLTEKNEKLQAQLGERKQEAEDAAALIRDAHGKAFEAIDLLAAVDHESISRDPELAGDVARIITALQTAANNALIAINEGRAQAARG